MIHRDVKLITIAKIAASNTNIFIDKPKKYIPKNVAIKLTGKAIAGTITALRFPKNR